MSSTYKGAGVEYCYDIMRTARLCLAVCQQQCGHHHSLRLISVKTTSRYLRSHLATAPNDCRSAVFRFFSFSLTVKAVEISLTIIVQFIAHTVLRKSRIRGPSYAYHLLCSTFDLHFHCCDLQQFVLGMLIHGYFESRDPNRQSRVPSGTRKGRNRRTYGEQAKLTYGSHETQVWVVFPGPGPIHIHNFSALAVCQIRCFCV